MQTTRKSINKWGRTKKGQAGTSDARESRRVVGTVDVAVNEGPQGVRDLRE